MCSGLDAFVQHQEASLPPVLVRASYGVRRRGVGRGVQIACHGSPVGVSVDGNPQKPSSTQAASLPTDTQARAIFPSRVSSILYRWLRCSVINSNS
jgi:hypothetical protein